MKNLTSRFTILLLICLTIPVTATAQTVAIPDANLRAAVKTALGKAPGDPITQDEMATLTELDASSADISDLTGLEGAVNLSILRLGGNSLSDISVLAGLTNLTLLGLSSNSLSDISALAGLTNLTELNLYSNSVSDISALAGLTNLTFLDFGWNSASDISVLAGLTNLTYLGFDDNSVSDISVLANLTNLTYLTLYSNSLSDISALAGLTNLTFLDFGWNSVSDISVLANFTNLKRLRLEVIAVADISALAGLTNLTDLSLAANQLSDISVLTNLTKLKKLNLAKTSISDVSVLSDLTNLTYLNLGSNSISDVSALASLTNLTYLPLDGNSLSYESIHTHIPALQNRGVKVEFDNRDPAALLKVSGELTASDSVMIVEVRDGNDRPFEGVPVTFSVISGGGALSVTDTATDSQGRAQSQLSFGSDGTPNRVEVSAAGIQQSVTFSDEGDGSDAVAGSVAIPDANLRAAIETALGKAPGDPISQDEMATLIELEASTANISDLTGLEGATNLESLYLHGANITDISALAGLTDLTVLWLQNSWTISDISALSGLTNLTELYFGGHKISDVSVLAGLTNLTTVQLGANSISDISAFAGLINLTGLWISYNEISDISALSGLTNLESLNLAGNKLSYESIHTLIPALQSGGVEVEFDSRDPATLLKVSGELMASDSVMIVEVRDSDDRTFEGVPVTFSVISGGGTLSVTDTATDSQGRAQSQLSFGSDGTPNRVEVSAAGIQQSVTFSEEGDGSDAVAIPDANLRAAVETALGKAPGDPITQDEMATLTKLNGFRANISDLSGLEGATNLLSLYLPYNSISDISALSDLTNLTYLRISANSVSDISVLSALTDLTSLNLSSNSISDISALTGLTNLTDLYLGGNEISDISALSGLTNLTSLRLDNNLLSDISALSGLANLTSLELGRNSLSDISALAGLTNLTSLNLSSNSISDISALTGLTNLTDLYLGGDEISDISALAALTNLTSLELDNNSLSDISVLSGLTNLTDLRLDNNSLSDISALSELTNLIGLYLGGNEISDISALAALTNLTSLGLDNNLLLDIPVLSGLTNLADLYLEGNEISDISALAALTNLTELFLGGNSLSYVSIHTHIPALQNRGVEVYYDSRAPSALLKISGELTASDSVMIVEVRDSDDHPFEGVPVTFRVTSGGGTLSVTDTATDSQGRAQSQLSLGSDGTPNRVEVSAAEIEEQLTFEAISDAEPQPIAGDANGDGGVNILDLVFVASQFGKQGTGLAADANGDGAVNILDLVYISGIIGAGNAAPSAQPQTLETLTAAEIRDWLEQARSLDVEDATLKRGMVALQRLAVSLTPSETALLPNYPNPFNPETWIPYRLAEDAVVTLTIYDLNGQVVRTLDVGHPRAAVYERQSDAIYWDGKNDLGERVGSGVYFYHLSAGDYSATRKMVILK